MASLHRTGTPDRTSARVARDALSFVRIGGPEAVAFFRADDQEGAAAALLTYSAVPATAQDDADLTRRRLECTKALPAQGIPGFAASVLAAKWLTFLFGACVLGAAGWALVDLFAGDPNRDPFLLPAEVVFLPFEEILLLAPLVLLAVYVPVHLAACWKERTTTRAVLRWAADDDASRRLGIPAQSPFAGIMASWQRLQLCAGGVLTMDGFLAVFLYLVHRSGEPDGLFLAPVACALPILAAYLLCSARLRLAQRRHVLAADRLFRVPRADAVSLPTTMTVEGLGHPVDSDGDFASPSGDEGFEKTVDKNTEWKSGF